MGSLRYSSCILRLSVFIATFTAWDSSFGQILEDYLRTPEPAYNIRMEPPLRRPFYTFHRGRFTSLTWKSQIVTPSHWDHNLQIIQPRQLKTDKVLLIIDGGDGTPLQGDLEKEAFYQSVILAAMTTGAIIAKVDAVPNQPLIFPDDPTPRSEDALIAFSFARYLNTGDASWPALLPMVKSVVKAMDTIERVLAGVRLGGFVLTGASKRGWTTWLASAVDPRVIGQIPIVFDALDIRAQLKLQLESYGRYSDMLSDYQSLNLPELILKSPHGENLLSIVDPIYYRDRLQMPKLLVLSSGDDFFCVDSANLYFNRLGGPTYLSYLPNSGHMIGDIKSVLRVAINFFNRVTRNQALPPLRWEADGTGSYTLQWDTPPIRINRWLARASNRDFRFKTIGGSWAATPLAPPPTNFIQGTVSSQPGSYQAFFLELVYRNEFGSEFSLTTPMQVMAPAR